MARLDQQATAKAVVQLGATIEREFSCGLIATIAPLDETTPHQGLQKLVKAELIYRRGLPHDSQYQFKHALLQDTADQSLLKHTRKKYHQEIAQVLEEQFAEVATMQPELLTNTTRTRACPSSRYRIGGKPGNGRSNGRPKSSISAIWPTAWRSSNSVWR